MGQTVLIRCRARPAKHTNQQCVYVAVNVYHLLSLFACLFLSEVHHFSCFWSHNMSCMILTCPALASIMCSLPWAGNTLFLLTHLGGFHTNTGAEADWSQPWGCGMVWTGCLSPYLKLPPALMPLCSFGLLEVGLGWADGCCDGPESISGGY